MRPAILVAIVVFVVQCLAGAAYAKSPSAADQEKAKRLFIQGNTAFTEGRYSDALASYQASHDLVPRSRSLYNIATCLERLDRAEEAFVYYERFLKEAETRDADFVSKANAKIDELRRSIRISVNITSNPIGASIRQVEGGPAVGRTPTTLSLPMGKQTLIFESSGHAPKTESIELLPGKIHRLDVQLDSYPKVTLTTSPSDATVEYLTTNEVSAGSFSKHLAPGVHKFKITHPDYKPQKVEVPVDQGDVSKVVRLERIEAEMPAVTPLQDEPPTARRSGGLLYGGLALTVLGLGGAGFGAYQGIVAKGYSDDAQDAAADGVWSPQDHQDAKDAQTLMYIGYGVGGALVVTGITMMALSGSSDDEGASETAIVPSIDPSGASVHALFHF